jgi:hypothetical protein
MLSTLRSVLTQRPVRVRRTGSDRQGLRVLGDRAGQALAEFVLIIPVLLLLVFGIVEFGLAFRTHQIVTNAAREGARVAVLPSSDEDRARDVVVDRLESAGLPLGDLEPEEVVRFRCLEDEDDDEGEEGWCEDDRFAKLTQVVVTYPYTFFVLGGLVRWACGADCASQYGTIDLRTASAMRNE